MAFSKTTGEATCPGQRICEPSSKRFSKTYKIGAPGVLDPVSRSQGGRGAAVKIALEPPAGSYTTKSEPCKSGRVGCPVQLIFKDNVPHVRFCGASRMVEKKDKKTGSTKLVRVGASEMGWIVPVKTPSAARRLVAEACEQWKRDGGFTEGNVAVIEAKAARAGVGPDQALGRARRRAR